MDKFNFRYALILMAGFFIQSATALYAQPEQSNRDKSILWEISGNGVKEPSYLFGTFHLLTSSFVEGLPAVMEKFYECESFAGELIIDSTLMPKMQAAAYLQGTTLDKLLTPSEYDSTAKWLKDLSGYDLSIFNAANPMTISTIISAFVQQTVLPTNITNPEPGMDGYFQQLSIEKGKPVFGLETVDDQINALYTQFTPERQAELLLVMVHQKHLVEEGMRQMLESYRQFNLSELMSLMYDETFSRSEVEVLLDNRNKNWMKQLPGMMKSSSVFVAVGALHLGGEQGLIQLLRNAGYTVKPINI